MKKFFNQNNLFEDLKSKKNRERLSGTAFYYYYRMEKTHKISRQ